MFWYVIFCLLLIFMSQHNVNLRIYWLFYITSHVFLVFILHGGREKKRKIHVKYEYCTLINGISFVFLFLRYFLFLKNLSMEQVLVEPGTPHGFGIISQMRSHILWMEKRVSSLFLIEHSLAQELCYDAY
jgi:hypothetical protein